MDYTLCLVLFPAVYYQFLRRTARGVRPLNGVHEPK